MAISVSWSPIITPGAPTARYGCSMVSTSDGLQVFGGYSTHYLNEFLALSTTLNTRKWRLRRKSRPYPAGRRGHIMVETNDSLLLFGGDLGSECVNDLWLCTGSDWKQVLVPTKLDTFPTGRYGHAGCILGSSFYIFGGADRYHQTSMFNDLWLLDLTTLHWERGPTGPSPRYGHSMVGIDRNIFVIGGMTHTGLTNDVWHLSVREELYWTQLTPMTGDYELQPCTELFALALSDRTIILFGGSSTEKPLNDIWVLNLHLETNQYSAIQLQLPTSLSLPAPRHAFGAACTTRGSISSAKPLEISTELGIQDRSIAWLTKTGLPLSSDNLGNIQDRLFDGFFAKIHVFGGRGTDSSLNDLWMCTICLLDETRGGHGVTEIKAAEQIKVNGLGNSLSNINYPPNSDIDLCRSSESFVEYNSHTLSTHTTGLYISDLMDNNSFHHAKSTPQKGVRSRKPSLPRFPESEHCDDKQPAPRHCYFGDARVSYAGSNSINDPSLLSNNVTTPNDEQLIQPTDEVQKYLMTQVMTINDNLLRMEAAFKVDEITRKFTADLESQSSIVEELALAVSEFKDNVMNAIDGITQKLSGYAANQQAHEEDLVELNNKITELDNLLVERIYSITKHELIVEMQVQINSLREENKALTARLINVESLLIASTLASKPSNEIMTLLNAVVSQSASSASTPVSVPATKLKKEGQLSETALQGVYEEIQEMGKKLNALSSSIGSGLKAPSEAPQHTIEERIAAQFRQQSLPSEHSLRSQQQAQQQVQQQRTVTMTRSAGTLSTPLSYVSNSRPTSAFLSMRGRSRPSSTSHGPTKESLAMIEKVLNAPEELSDS